MKLYATTEGRWATSKVAARHLAERGGTAMEVDVPTTKEALVHFLNFNRVLVSPAWHGAQVLEHAND